MGTRDFPCESLTPTGLWWQREQQCQHICVPAELAKHLCLDHTQLIRLWIERARALRQLERNGCVPHLQLKHGKCADWPG